MIISGLLKTTLLDYPHKLASTIFLGGCNFRCPFCHNMNLVLNPLSEITYTEEEILEFLSKRKGILEGVCITGGEPTLNKDLYDFISKIKDLSYPVKLDTNGSNPDLLLDLYNNNLIDYIAMDIKTELNDYPRVCGLASMDTKPILSSIEFLLSNKIEYEFRTTIVSNYHSDSTIINIGKLIKGAKNYYLQSFKDSDNVSDHSLLPVDKEKLLKFKELLEPYVENVFLRGID